MWVSWLRGGPRNFTHETVPHSTGVRFSILRPQKFFHKLAKNSLLTKILPPRKYPLYGITRSPIPLSPPLPSPPPSPSPLLPSLPLPSPSPSPYSSTQHVCGQVVSERNLMKHISDGLMGNSVEVKVAACKCLHSLSRSTKLLRTSIIDAEVWKPVLEVRDCTVRVHIMQYLYIMYY